MLLQTYSHSDLNPYSLMLTFLIILFLRRCFYRYMIKIAQGIQDNKPNPVTIPFTTYERNRFTIETDLYPVIVSLHFYAIAFPSATGNRNFLKLLLLAFFVVKYDEFQVRKINQSNDTTTSLPPVPLLFHPKPMSCLFLIRKQ